MRLYYLTACGTEVGLADENQGVARAASLLEAPGEGLFSGLFRSPEVPASLGWRPRPLSPELAVIPLSLCFHLTAALTPFSLTRAWRSHWAPWQGPLKPLRPRLKILHLLHRQSLSPRKAGNPWVSGEGRGRLWGWWGPPFCSLILPSI